MLEEVKKMLRQVSADSEILNLLAEIHFKFYLALIGAGFTKEQALEICTKSPFSPSGR